MSNKLVGGPNTANAIYGSGSLLNNQHIMQNQSYLAATAQLQAYQMFSSQASPRPCVSITRDGVISMTFRLMEHGTQGTIFIGVGPEDIDRGTIATIFCDGTVLLGHLADKMDDAAKAFWAAVSGITNGRYICYVKTPPKIQPGCGADMSLKETL